MSLKLGASQTLLWCTSDRWESPVGQIWCTGCPGSMAEGRMSNWHHLLSQLGVSIKLWQFWYLEHGRCSEVWKLTVSCMDGATSTAKWPIKQCGILPQYPWPLAQNAGSAFIKLIRLQMLYTVDLLITNNIINFGVIKSCKFSGWLQWNKDHDSSINLLTFTNTKFTMY